MTVVYKLSARREATQRVSCPHCGAPAGVRCSGKRRSPGTPHRSRVERALDHAHIDSLESVSGDVVVMTISEADQVRSLYESE